MLSVIVSAIRNSLTPPLQRIAVPVGQGGSGLVGALAKLHNGLAGSIGGAHVLVFEKKFPHLRVPISGVWPYGLFFESGGSGFGVRIEGCLREIKIARPKPKANDFVRIGFAGY